MPAPHGPLAGLRVLDLSRVLAGPYCTMVLANLGADVVKVERPGGGDETRAWGPPFAGGESAYYLSVNNSKRSITLDLALPAGREVARALALRCDVLLENFKPGTMEAWGLGDEDLLAANPGLIYCAISGFSRRSSQHARPGYDLLAQALGGIMSITGDPRGEPTKVGVAVVDVTAGLYAGMGILAALHARSASGAGQRIDINLLDSAAAWLVNVGGNYLVSGEVPLRHGNAHPNIVPYQAFRAADGHLVLAVGNDVQWQRLCAAAGWTDLAADARYTTNAGRVANRLALIEQLAQRFAAATVDTWVSLCAAADVPAGRVNTVDRVLDDPELLGPDMVTSLPHPTAGTVRVVGPPIALSATPATVRAAPPLLGQHTAEVLREWLAYDEAAIAALRDLGAL